MKNIGKNEMISVIVPAYNVDKYISECIESILNSSYKDIELILVDDGSTDNSANIIKHYESMDCRVKTISQSNAGAAAARNKGVLNCTGDYIAFVDSDDYIDCDYLEYLHKLLKEYEADVTQVSPRRVTDTGIILNQSIIDEFDKKQEKIHFYTGLEAIEYYLIGGHHALWGHLYRADLFKNISIPEGMTEEDMTVIIPLYEQCNRIVRVDVYKYNYRYNMGGVTNSPRNERSFKAYWEFKRQYMTYSNNMQLHDILCFCCVGELQKMMNVSVLDKKGRAFIDENQMRRELKEFFPRLKNNKYCTMESRLKILLYLTCRPMYRMLLVVTRIGFKKKLYGHPGY